MCETGLVLSELTHMIQHIEEYAEEQDVHTPISQFAARSYKKPVPLWCGSHHESVELSISPFP